jgi:hypothetical protein
VPVNPIIVTIADECPTCAANEVDLSLEAWSALTGDPTGNGRYNVLLERVECPVPAVGGTPFLTVQSVTNPFYLSVVVEGAGRAIASVSVQASGQATRPMIRQSFNAFTLSPPSELSLPLTFTVTDDRGATRIFTVNSLMAGNTTFPAFPSSCP